MSQQFFVNPKGGYEGSWGDVPSDWTAPEDWIEVPYGPEHADQVWQLPNGPYGPSRTVATNEENAWREAELAGVPDEIAKVEDEDPAAIGTVQDWRDFRKALRLWVDGNPDFPFGSRPPRPT